MSAQQTAFEQALGLDQIDELEELLTESTTRTVKASTVSDLDDLDALLEESTVLASAKRAKAQGRKLTAEQSALLEVNRLAAEAELWITQAYYAHITISECECGLDWQDFGGWYAAQEQRNKSNRRLIRVAEPAFGYAHSQYISRRKVSACPHCLRNLPVATIEQNDLLQCLGGC